MPLLAWCHSSLLSDASYPCYLEAEGPFAFAPTANLELPINLLPILLDLHGDSYALFPESDFLQVCVCVKRTQASLHTQANGQADPLRRCNEGCVCQRVWFNEYADTGSKYRADWMQSDYLAHTVCVCSWFCTLWSINQAPSIPE